MTTLDPSFRAAAGVEELDRRRRSGNARSLAVGLSVAAAVMAPSMQLAHIDGRVEAVTLGAAALFAGCAILAGRGRGDVAAPLLNATLVTVLFAGVAVNRQIGPGPAFIGFSLFVAAATLTLGGVIIGGFVGALAIAGMCYVARQEPQLALQPAGALTYGLALCFVTTTLSVVQSVNTRRALAQVVEREQRALVAEAIAREGESRYRLIADNMSDLIALLDRDGRFVYASPSFERILGVAPEDLLRERRPEVTHPDDRPRVAADFAEALARGKARGTYRSRDRAGRHLWIECVYDSVSGADGPLVAIAARDVTENRALAEQLHQAQKMDALGRMAAAVAHDFNNLLTVIGAAVSYARRDLPEASKAQSALLDAERAADGAASLTARLLAFSRKEPVAPQVVDARVALNGLVSLLPRALGPDIELDLRLDAELPRIAAAPVQLEQVLLNLALNARDAMPDGGRLSVVARARHLVDGEESDCRPGSWLHVEVSDTGRGMSQDVLAHLFEPFFTTKPAGEGTGLGLSTCYGIVRQLGGRIRAFSVPGQGTTFTVLLPQAAGATERS